MVHTYIPAYGLNYTNKHLDICILPFPHFEYNIALASGKEKNSRRKAFGRISRDKIPRQRHHSVLKFPSLEPLIWQQRNKTFDSRWNAAGRTKTCGENGDKELHGIFLKCLLKRSKTSQHHTEDKLASKTTERKRGDGNQMLMSSQLPLNFFRATVGKQDGP